MGFVETIDTALKESDLRLLGQIDISEDEYEELIQYSRKRIQSLEMQSIVPRDIYLSVSLVQIAIRKYSDGNYWDFFKSEMESDVPISGSKLRYVGQMFMSTIGFYHLFQIGREENANNAYVENIKAHAFVPTNYLQGYYDFLFSFYDRNLLRQLPDDLSEDVSEMADFFANTLKDTSDRFVLQNLDNKPAKTYRLLKATRTLFAQGDPIVLSKILYSHLKLLDDYYYDGVDPSCSDRFAIGFSDWIQATTESIERGTQRGRRQGNVFYRKPYFSIDRKTGNSYLVIPEQKIRNEDYEKTVSVTIHYANVYQEEDLNLYRAFGVLVSESKITKVDNIFDEFTITISSKSEKVFTIPSKDYRVFDEGFGEIPKLRDGQNYLLVKKDVEVQGEEPVYINHSNPKWDEYSFADIDDASVIYVGNVPVSTSGSFVVGAYYGGTSSEYELYDQEQLIQTTLKHPSVSFKVSKDSVEGSIIRVGERRFPLKNCAASIVDLPNEKGTCGITVLGEGLFPDNDGHYIIILEEPRKSPRNLCDYVLLRSFNCHPQKSRYVFEDEALITICDGYDIKPLNCVRINESSNYILPLKNGVESAVFSIQIDDHIYTIRIPVKVFKHGFEGKLESAKPDDLWHTDLKNDLYISMPGAKSAEVFLDGKQMRSYGTSLGNGLFRFDISSIVQTIRASDHPYNSIMIRYTDDIPRSFLLYQVLNRLLVSRTDVFFDKDGCVAVNVEYKGKADLVFRFVTNDTKKTMVVERAVKNGINRFPELSGNSLYALQMFEATPDSFGFVKEEKEIGRLKRGVGAINLEDITNCRIVFKGATWSGVKLRFNYTYRLSNLQKMNDYCYYGTLSEQKRSYSPEDRNPIVTIAENVLVECIPDETRLVVVSLQTEYEKGVFDPIYYDTRLRKYIPSENAEGYDYDRYVAMYNDEAVFETEIRRIK